MTSVPEQPELSVDPRDTLPPTEAEPPPDTRPALVEWVLMLAAWGREALAKDAEAES